MFSIWNGNSTEGSQKLLGSGNLDGKLSSSDVSLPRVAVHSRTSPPLIDDNGLMVEANTATDIAIERVGMKQRFAKIAT